MSIKEQQEAERQRQMDVLQDMTELFDSLPTREAQREILAFLATRGGGRYFEPQTSTHTVPNMRRKPKSW